MLAVTYLDHNTGEQHSVGPATHFRLIGPSLRMGLQEEEVARFHHHFGCWYVADSAADIMAIAEIEIQPAGPAGLHPTSLGPFEYIRLVGNILRQRRSTDKPVARLEPALEQWRLLEDNTLWTELVLVPAVKIDGFRDPPGINTYASEDRRRRADQPAS